LLHSSSLPLRQAVIEWLSATGTYENNEVEEEETDDDMIACYRENVHTIHLDELVMR